MNPHASLESSSYSGTYRVSASHLAQNALPSFSPASASRRNGVARRSSCGNSRRNYRRNGGPGNPGSQGLMRELCTLEPNGCRVCGGASGLFSETHTT
jgi:hypothetical protein